MLKTKTGEAIALRHLLPAERARIFPVFHVGEKPPARFVAQMATAWVGQEIALDGAFNFGFKASTADFTNLFSQLTTAGLQVIPSIDVGTTGPYLAVVQALAKSTHGRLVLKSTLAEVPQAAAWAATNGWVPGNIDLIVDLKSIAGHDPTSFAHYVAHTLKATFHAGSPWLSLTLASSAAPKDHTGIAVGRCVLPRLDWALWNSVAKTFPVRLDYGDYTVSHPDLTEPPGAAMARASVSARYATDLEWIVHRGHSISGPNGQPMNITFAAHANALVSDSLFGGLPACWGDQRITAIASGSSPGGRTQWAEITTSRHMTLVANRLP